MKTEILEMVKKDEIKFVELEFTDIFGTLKSIDIPVECLRDAIEGGVWFDGSSIKGFARLKESDMYLQLDLETYAIVPGCGIDKKTARFFCDVFTPDGKLFAGSPRSILKKAIKEAKEMGFEFKVGPEVEFYLFKRKDDGTIVTPEFDTGSYFDSSTGDVAIDIRKDIMVALKFCGITSERAHHEVGKGQHEIGFRYGDPLITADRVITLKKIIKSIAHKYGYIASFMPKPMFGKPGSGMHIHFSIFDMSGKALFFDETDKHKLSSLAKSFIAGELKYVREMSLLLNPTVSSYKRLVAGYEAPVYVCWGSKNRSSLVRIPRYTKGKESSVRAELRCPDVSASPYLAFAAMLKAGLEGVKRKLELMPATEESVFEKSVSELKELGIEMLPGSLSEAVDSFGKSELMKEFFGKEFFEKYIEAKKREVEEYRVAVTDWEVDRYLEKC